MKRIAWCRCGPFHYSNGGLSSSCESVYLARSMCNNIYSKALRKDQNLGRIGRVELASKGPSEHRLCLTVLLLSCLHRFLLSLFPCLLYDSLTTPSVFPYTQTTRLYTATQTPHRSETTWSLQPPTKIKHLLLLALARVLNRVVSGMSPA